MVYFWARWLPEALSKDPEVAKRLILHPGWENRGRPADTFSFLPTGIVEHHTACMCKVGHDPQSCINGILAGNTSAPGPVSQVFISWTPIGVKWNGSNPDPRVVVIAAGRANHAGSGQYPWGAPSGNGSSLGIEVCGPAAWPDVVIDIRERVSAAILRHNGWGAHQITTHNEYVEPVRPGAKIDPSGATKYQPNLAVLQPWNPDIWRQAVQRQIVQPVPEPPTPTPTPEDIDMIVIEWGITVLTWNGPQLAWVRSGGANPALKRASVKRISVNDAELLSIINSTEQTTEAPYTLTPEMAAAWVAPR